MTALDHYRTLMLDSSYRPVKVIPWTRAIALGMTDKAYVVETYDRTVRSPSVELPMPAVIALKRYLKYRPFKVRFSKRNIFVRDGFTCQYCGERLPGSKLTIDHVVPRAQGGQSRWENVVTACEPCNHRKGDRTPAQAGMPLLSEPMRPTPSVHGEVVARSVPPEWSMYIGGAHATA